MSDVRSWLAQLGLEKYGDAFADADVDYDILAELSDNDLRELGLSLGHRRKFLKAIAQQASSEREQPAAERPAQAERRHLTVMFVDLVGSTALSGRLDPEDMRAVLTGYQNAVAGVVTRFAGHVARYMGDGVLCYFGWPRANEDDAERAVRAGLEVLQAIDHLRTPKGERLQARVGLATGLVVVGDLIGDTVAEEEAVVGDTPNLAARLQAIASPGEIAVGEATRQLLGDIFELKELGHRKLKGVVGRPLVYAVVGERAAESRFLARASGKVATMIGRQQELTMLRDHWRRAREGHGQFVLLTGEAGIGKSRISRAMIDELDGVDDGRISFQCSPYHTDTALYPAVQQLLQAARITADDSNEDRLGKLEEICDEGEVPLIAALLGIDCSARYEAPKLAPAKQRTKTLEALAGWLMRQADRKPLLVVFEDVHWIDATTLELLDLCLDRVAEQRILMLVTARPTFKHGFAGHPAVTRLTLNRLGPEDVESIVRKIAGGKELPEALIREITDKTDGVPLFVEELTKTVLESGDLRESATAYELTGMLSQVAIPATLHDSLMARLDRLQPIKEVAQTAACIGREFNFELLAAVSRLDRTGLQDALDQLVEAELIFRRGPEAESEYIFKHALVRDAAYESLLKSTRQFMHGKLVVALEAQSGCAPEILAYHCTQAGQLPEAIGYWREAGNAALARPAYTEAISHFSAAIALIGEMEESAHWINYELDLQLQLAQVYLTKHGYSGALAARVYARAAELIEKTNRPELLVPVRYGIWIGHYLRAEHKQALPMVKRLVEETNRLGERVPRLLAHRMCAATQVTMGIHPNARQNLETALELYEAGPRPAFSGHFAQEPGIQILAQLIVNLWMMGFPEQAAAMDWKSQALAEDIGHVNTTCYGSVHRVVYAMLSGQDDLVRRSNAMVIKLAELHELVTWQAYSLFGDLLIRGRDGDVDALGELSEAIDKNTALGDWLFVPFYKTMQVSELLRHDRVDQALEEIRVTEGFIRQTNEEWMLPELLRLKGDAWCKLQDCAQAEDEYRRARKIAANQSAKAWELRAAVSHADLKLAQGDGEMARDILQPIHDWFSEGRQTPDLMAAKALLDDIA